MPRNSRHLIALLPAIVANAYSLYGIVRLNWSVVDVLFWFWCEFVFIAIATFCFLVRHRSTLPPSRLSFRAAISMFLFGFLIVLFYITLFACIAFKGEWHSWSRLPFFLSGKAKPVTFLSVAFVIAYFAWSTHRRTSLDALHAVSAAFNRKSIVVVGLYAVMLVHGWIREWFMGVPGWDLSTPHLQMLGCSLIILKLAAEVGLFDRLVTARRLQRTA